MGKGHGKDSVWWALADGAVRRDPHPTPGGSGQQTVDRSCRVFAMTGNRMNEPSGAATLFPCLATRFCLNVHRGVGPQSMEQSWIWG